MGSNSERLPGLIYVTGCMLHILHMRQKVQMTIFTLLIYVEVNFLYDLNL